MIKYVKGDLLEAPHPFIVHQVNCQGVMGAGVAKSIKDKYPVVFSRYKDLVDSYARREVLLGHPQIIKISDNLSICNLFAQNKFGYDKRYTSYDAIETGLRHLKNTTVDPSTHIRPTIAMSKIGCGLGGGDWKIVSAIIESVFDDRDIYIYEL